MPPAAVRPTIEANFGRGIVGDEPRSSIPPGGVYDASDFLFEKPGVAYKRGGSGVAGPPMDGMEYGHSCFYADYPTGAKLIAIGVNSTTNSYSLFEVGSTSTTNVAPLTLNFLGKDKPKIRVDTVALCANDGVTAPKKAYINGGSLAVGNIGGSPPAGRYSEVYSTRLVLANVDGDENRVYFSPTPNIEDTWDTTDGYIDADYSVTGLASLSSGLIIFSEGHTEIITGTTPPPATDMSRRTMAAIGLKDARSIAKYDNNVIFANTHGVYVTNGTAFDSITKKQDGTGISKRWQAQFENDFGAYDPDLWTITAEAFLDFYFVSILDQFGALVNTWVCHLPSQAWTRFDNWTPMMFTTSVGLSEEAYFVSRADSQVYTVSSVFIPDVLNKTDADGQDVEPTLEYRMLGDGPSLKAYGFGRLTYDCRDAAADDPTIAVSVASGIEAPTFTAAATLTETTDATRKRFVIGKDSQAVNIRMVQTGASEKTELYSLEGEVRSYPFTHDGVA